MNWQNISRTLYQWLMTFGPRLLFGLIAVVVGLWLIGVLRRWMNHHLLRKDVTSGNGDPDLLYHRDHLRQPHHHHP